MARTLTRRFALPQYSPAFLHLHQSRIRRPTELTVAEMIDGVVPVAAASFTMCFRKGSEHAPVSKLRSVEVLGHEGNIVYTITSMVSIVDGAIVAHDPEFILLWVNVMDPLFDTTLNAALGALPKLAIDTIRKDTVDPTRGVRGRKDARPRARRVGQCNQHQDGLQRDP